MRILYRSTAADEFDFIVRPASSERRALYAPDGDVRGSARFEAGSLIIRELTVIREKGLNGLSLRAVPLGQIRDQIVADLRDRPGLLDAARGGFVPVGAVRRLPKRQREAEPRQLRLLVGDFLDAAPQRGQNNDDFYRSLALAYIYASRVRPRDPVAALTAELRKLKRHRELSENTVMGWVRRARELEWLTPGVHGRPGASPGPRLLAEDIH